MKSQIIIQKATLEDLGTMWKMGEENWQLHPDPPMYKWYPKEDLKKWIENQGDDILLVAKDGNKTVGMSTTYIMQGWAYNDGLCVDSKYRGQGIGKILLDETVKILKNRGIELYSLLVNTKNTPALKFYLKTGFKQGHSYYWMNKDLKEEK